MNNNNDNGRLDEAVRKTLINYEAPYQAADWTQLESMLDVVPKQTPINKSYLLVAVVAFAILGAGSIAYKLIKSNEAPVQTIVVPPHKTIPVKPKSITVKPIITQTVAVVQDKSKVGNESDTTANIDKVVPKGPTTLVKREESKIKSEVKPIEKKEEDFKKEKTKKETLLKKEKEAKPESQSQKEKAFKEALLKASKKEQKAETFQTGNDTVHIDDENDSNRSVTQKSKNETNPLNKPDTLKLVKDKKSGKETKKSKRDKKTTKKDSLDESNIPTPPIN